MENLEFPKAKVGEEYSSQKELHVKRHGGENWKY